MNLRLMMLAFTLLGSNAYASPYATVISAVALTKTQTTPSQVCNDVSVPIYGTKRSSGGAIGGVVDSAFGSTEGLVGAIAGGYIGSKIGRGSGRKIATVTGAVIGAKVGDNQDTKKQEIVGYETQQRCSMVSRTETINAGYHVIYDYQGMTLSKLVQQKPVIGSKHSVSITIE
ncbi:glycine zipper 2TM domain-containing protein [Burkholderiales bacterium]|nr:glycine zipper 2TM domain-containing protein [Burkholderiales bacterium]